MVIKQLKLKNFRNYVEEHIEFDSNINILYGDNAQGKTNILEAIYLCSTSKSHRTSKNKEVILFGKEEAHITLDFVDCSVDEVIDIHLKTNNRKGIAINKIPIRQISDLIGKIHVIMFSPEDLTLIKSGPSERRRFINRELCQINKMYYYELKNYNKILKQRNSLLKQIQIHKADTGLLDLWDEQLVDSGKKIIEYRNQFIQHLSPIVHQNHWKISGKKEKLDVIYEMNCNEKELRNKLIKSRNYDIKIGSTNYGPHKDDLNFMINGIDIRQYGSQGQQRTAALALKLSEIEVIEEICDTLPILLLDDVLSELDQHRQHYLMECIKDIQTIITCTGIEDVLNNHLNVGKMYRIEDGKVYQDL